MRDALHAFVDAGKAVIGICNGFQVLVKTDLLPGTLAGETGQTCTLAHNDCGRFVDRWVTLEPQPEQVHLDARTCRERIELPIAHGEGKFVPADDAVRRRCGTSGQVALVYAKPTARRRRLVARQPQRQRPTTSPACATRPAWSSA